MLLLLTHCRYSLLEDHPKHRLCIIFDSCFVSLKITGLMILESLIHCPGFRLNFERLSWCSCLIWPAWLTDCTSRHYGSLLIIYVFFMDYFYTFIFQPVNEFWLDVLYRYPLYCGAIRYWGRGAWKRGHNLARRMFARCSTIMTLRWGTRGGCLDFCRSIFAR